MKRRVFITGGAGGLGYELAKQLVASGNQVLIGDVDADIAQKSAADIGASAIRCDVCSDAEVANAATWLQESWGGLDLLINNAGVAQMGSLASTSQDDWRWVMDINVFGVVRVSRVMLPLLPVGGRILNIASMAAFIGSPNAAAYSASKAAVLSLSETLMLELEPRGIDVHVACPAFFRTGLAGNMRAADTQLEQATKRLVERARRGAEEIAQLILDGVSRGENLILTHPEMNDVLQQKRELPFSDYLNVVRQQMKKSDERMARPEKDFTNSAV